VTGDKKPGNRQIDRKEEPTKALTPDKMDRSMKERGDQKPYPLTEEEATPNVSGSQKRANEAS
jgi:hypothetical protein